MSRPYNATWCNQQVDGMKCGPCSVSHHLGYRGKEQQIKWKKWGESMRLEIETYGFTAVMALSLGKWWYDIIDYPPLPKGTRWHCSVYYVTNLLLCCADEDAKLRNTLIFLLASVQASFLDMTKIVKWEKWEYLLDLMMCRKLQMDSLSKIKPYEVATICRCIWYLAECYSSGSYAL